MRLRRNADAPPDPEALPHRQSAAWGRDRDEQTYAAPTGLGVPELDELIRDLDHHKLGTGCRQALAFAFRSADIGAGGWRWTSHSPTGSGPEGSSPNERGSGRSSASHSLYFPHSKLRRPAREKAIAFSGESLLRI